MANSGGKNDVLNDVLTEIARHSKSMANRVTNAEEREDAGLFTAQRTITPTDSPYTITPFDGIIFADTTTGVLTAVLPTAVGIGGRHYILKDRGNGSDNNITIATFGSETIDGAPSYVIGDNYGSVALVSDGSNWLIAPSKGADQIGFDTLNNMLVVDESFTSDTPFWGVRAFDNLDDALVAASLLVGEVVLFANGYTESGSPFVISSGQSLKIYTTAGAFFAAGITVAAGGNLSLNGAINHVIVVAGPGLSVVGNAYFAATFSAFTLTVSGSGTPTIGCYSCEVGLIVSNLLAVDAIKLRDCHVSLTASGAAIGSVFTDVYFCKIIYTSDCALYPLNFSNVNDSGSTYREFVTLVSLPSAAANAGAVASTSDGGFVFSDGVVWANP